MIKNKQDAIDFLQKKEIETMGKHQWAHHLTFQMWVGEMLDEIFEQETQDNEIEKDMLFLNKKFTYKAMAEIAEMCVGSNIGIDEIADFVRYRAEIKKPLKTTRPLKLFINELKKVIEAGHDKRSAILIMKNHEWQTLNLNWIAKKLPKTHNADLTQFGFKSDAPKALK